MLSLSLSFTLSFNHFSTKYPRIFCASRIPGLVRDSIVTYTNYRPQGLSAQSKTTEYISSKPQHVVVICRNYMFKFNVFDQITGQPLSLNELEE